jgi:cell fate regulator YaaT (PSP1 superfamily)
MDIPMVSVAGIKVRDRGVAKKIGTGVVTLDDGDRVLLHIDNELTYGVVYGPSHLMPFLPPMRDMKAILRKADATDIETIARHEGRAREGMQYWRELLDTHRLPMKPHEVVCAFDHPKMVFTYTAEERVDFRVLVRDLSRRFQARIEMRQIGARDEARLIGGVGLCGLVLCCASFLTEFQPVSMKMVRAQGFPLDDNKLLGLCGRLKCCLSYEYEEEARPTLIQPTRPPKDPQHLPTVSP